MLEKSKEYKEVESQQNGEPIYAENINQIISNIEAIKGGESSKAPVGNIKDIYERLNNLNNKDSSSLSANLISFDNSNANLDFSTDEVDFPPIKNKLKDSYNIKISDTNNKSYDFILERAGDKYILKGSVKKYLFKDNLEIFFILNILEFDGIKDGGLITSELAQFFYCGQENIANANEIKIGEGIEAVNFKYTFKSIMGVPHFDIESYMGSETETEIEDGEYTIIFNIEVPIENIKNQQDYILFSFSTSDYSYFKIENRLNRLYLKGEITYSNNYSKIVIFSNSILESYFNIAPEETEENDSFYIIRNDDGITSNNEKLKYYFSKKNEGLSGLYTTLDEATGYYLNLKHADGTDIEEGEVISVNLPADKNTDIYKIQKEKNIQNAIEILNKKINLLINHVGLGYLENDIYDFEKATISIDEQTTLMDNETKDCSNLSLVKNADGSYSLKGNIETLGNSEDDRAILIKTTNKINKKLVRNIIPAITNQEKSISLFTLYNENYLYLYGQIEAENISNISLDNIKIIDSKIVLFNKDIIDDAELSDDFGIYYENGKYKLKGQFTQNDMNVQSYVNAGILDFFENGIKYEIPTTNENIYIRLASLNGIYNSLVLAGTTGQTYNLDWELPKQPLP